MRKIITGLMGTISGVALLFSYHTSTATQAATVAATATGAAMVSTGIAATGFGASAAAGARSSRRGGC